MKKFNLKKYKLMQVWPECKHLIRQMYEEYKNKLGKPDEIIAWKVVGKSALYPCDEPSLIYVGFVFKVADGKLYSYKLDVPIKGEFSFIKRKRLTKLYRDVEKFAKAIHEAHVEMFKHILGKLRTKTALPGYDRIFSFVDAIPYLSYQPPTDDPMYQRPNKRYEHQGP